MTKPLLALTGLLFTCASASAGEFPFTEEHWIKDTNGSRHVELVDLDQDKDTDVLVIEQARGGHGLTTIKWFQNKKKGTQFTERVIDSALMEGEHLTVGDVDGDGDLDIVASGNGRHAKPNGGIQWYENVGKAKAWTNHKIHHNGPPGTVRLGDLDGDGDLDVIVGARKQLTAYLNQGKGAKWSPKTIAKGGVKHHALVAMDYDGDKDLDLVARVDDTFVWIENNKGAWKSHLITNTSKHLPTSLQVVDFDQDGKLDLLVGAKRRVAVYMNYGKGKFGPEEVTQSGNMICSFQALAADVNRDGKLDVVVNYPRKMIWFELVEDDEWKPHAIGAMRDFAKYFAAGDLDGDGDTDLMRNKDTKYSYLWWENTATKATK